MENASGGHTLSNRVAALSYRGYGGRMTRQNRDRDRGPDPNRYIVYKGPDAEGWQFWEDEWHNRHDDMKRKVTRTAPIAAVISGTGPAKPVP